MDKNLDNRHIKEEFEYDGDVDDIGKDSDSDNDYCKSNKIIKLRKNTHFLNEYLFGENSTSISIPKYEYYISNLNRNISNGQPITYNNNPFIKKERNIKCGCIILGFIFYFIWILFNISSIFWLNILFINNSNKNNKNKYLSSNEKILYIIYHINTFIFLVGNYITLISYKNNNYRIKNIVVIYLIYMLLFWTTLLSNLNNLPLFMLWTSLIFSISEFISISYFISKV